MTMPHATTPDTLTLGRFLAALGGAPWRLSAGKVTGVMHANQLDNVRVFTAQHSDVRFTIPEGRFAWVALATEDRDARLAALERLMRVSAHQPTWIIGHGDRYVALWQLREPTDPKKVARVNAKLAAAFGGEDVDDATAPLPGSSGATVALHRPDAVYDVDHLAKARPPAIKLDAGEQAALDDEQAALLAELNERHAVLTQEHSESLITCIDTNPQNTGRVKYHLLSVAGFRQKYGNVKVAITGQRGVTYERAGKWWLEHPKRREYLGFTFMPGVDDKSIDGYLNLWTGWGVEPREGDWSLMRQHVLDVLAAGNEEHAAYIIKWCAWAVQNPNKPAGVALVFQGSKGAGKSVFGEAVRDLFGAHGLSVSNPEHVTGKFNGHLEACCLLVAEEALIASNKVAENALKVIITQPRLTIEPKGRQVKPVDNMLHVIMLSNDDWVVPASHDERRYAVFRASNVALNKPRYFDRLFYERDNGGLSAMLHDLLAMDLGDWNPWRGVPQTVALAEQKAKSLRGADSHLYSMLESGIALGCLRAEGESVFVSTALCAKAMGLDTRQCTKLGLSLGKAGGRSDRVLVSDGHQRGQHRGYWLPKLAEARQRWARAMGIAVPWPSDDGRWDQADASDGAGRAF